MAKTVKRTMYYPTFNEKKNEFDYEEVTHERPMTAQESKWDKIMDISLLIWIFFSLASLIGLIVCICADIQWWGITNFIILMFSSVGGVLINNFIIEPQYDKAFADSETIGFEAEILKWEQQTQEQNEIAEKWRAEHEFEELIRKAKLTANCNDIAQAAVYYAEHYIHQ